MARVNVSQTHNKTVAEVKEIVDGVIDDLHSRYGINSTWQNDSSVKFKRSGVTGELHINEGNVTINLSLGLMLSGFAGKIKSELTDVMGRKLS